MHVISLDTHKRYSLAGVETTDGERIAEERIEHRRGAIRDFLRRWDPGSPVALETSGSYYWIVTEIEEAGMVPRLVHARKARARIGETNKSDRITVRGLNMLQHTKRLPTVWIPPPRLRDLRELTRTRMYFSQTLTGFKCCVHSELAKHGLAVEASDIFGARARGPLLEAMAILPEHTRFATGEQLDYVDHLGEEVAEFDRRIAGAFAESREVELIDTLPGVGPTLSVVIWLEVGDVARFPEAENLATYAGTTPTLYQSGNRRWLGPVRRDVNQYLKWAYVEAANVVCLNQERWSTKYVVEYYRHVRDKRGHGKAIVAAARHPGSSEPAAPRPKPDLRLAESTWWVLKKREPYRERGIGSSSRGA